jgi:hypothetical protein
MLSPLPGTGVLRVTLRDGYIYVRDRWVKLILCKCNCVKYFRTCIYNSIFWESTFEFL